jgi:hypothetical protein
LPFKIHAPGCLITDQRHCGPRVLTALRCGVHYRLQLADAAIEIGDDALLHLDRV